MSDCVTLRLAGVQAKQAKERIDAFICTLKTLIVALDDPVGVLPSVVGAASAANALQAFLANPAYSGTTDSDSAADSANAYPAVLIKNCDNLYIKVSTFLQKCNGQVENFGINAALESLQLTATNGTDTVDVLDVIAEFEAASEFYHRVAQYACC